MKIERFEIEFINARQFKEENVPIFYSGQSVTFKVVVDCPEPVKCQGIEVDISGKAYALVQTKNSTINETLETYLEQKSAIFTPPTDGPNAGHHPAGHAEYQFTFQLPPAAPSSFFEKTYGGIAYSITAALNRSWHLPQVSYKSLCVIRNLCLDQQPADLVGPYSGEAFLDPRTCCILFSCFCTGKIHANIHLDRRGYLCGEPITIVGEIRNESCSDLDKVTIEIRKKLKFKGKSAGTKVEAAILVPGVRANESLQLRHQLPVPTGLVSSHLQGCSVINLNYYLIVHAHNRICPIAKTNFCELIIGDVKNQHQLQQQQMYQQQQQMYQQQQQMYPQQQMYYPPGESSTQYEFGAAVGLDSQALQQSQWIPGYPVLPGQQLDQF